MQLQQGDCMELMKDIPDESIDLVLCDLPYGTTDCKWDKVIPIDALWEQYKRIVTSHGTILQFGSEPFSTKLRSAAMKLYKYDWIWIKNKTTGFQHAKNMPLKRHELISVFSKGSMGHKSLLGDKRMTYNPQGTISENIVHNGAQRKYGSIIGHRPSHKSSYVQDTTNYPDSILLFPKEGKTLHPTQKPVALLEYLIKTYTNPGELVLDNCMGSGSTGVACVNTGRDFIGIELDEKFFEIAKQRIKEAQGG